jgi:hypothetical protein
MCRSWEADPSALYDRRLGKSAKELGNSDGKDQCPDIWRLDNGDIAVIGRDQRPDPGPRHRQPASGGGRAQPHRPDPPPDPTPRPRRRALRTGGDHLPRAGRRAPGGNHPLQRSQHPRPGRPAGRTSCWTATRRRSTSTAGPPPSMPSWVTPGSRPWSWTAWPPPAIRRTRWRPGGTGRRRWGAWPGTTIRGRTRSASASSGASPIPAVRTEPQVRPAEAERGPW